VSTYKPGNSQFEEDDDNTDWDFPYGVGEKEEKK
jgi:hypothetical protein